MTAQKYNESDSYIAICRSHFETEREHEWMKNYSTGK